jgi:hypothetical protein
MYRRVMPQIIANDIMGVSPMRGPVDSIFNLRFKYDEHRMPMSKEHYRIFLRINDRPKRQPVRAFLAAGYPTEICYAFVAADWCREQFGRYGFLRFGSTFIFKDEADALLFRIRWL